MSSSLGTGKKKKKKKGGVIPSNARTNGDQRDMGS